MSEPRSRTWAAVAAGLAAVGLVALAVAITGQRTPPQPAATDVPTAATSTAPGAAAPPSSAPAPPPLGPPSTSAGPVAAPVTITIPAIDVTSGLLRLGLDDGAVEVPPLGPDDRAGWYDRGPAPGAIGPAIILGHVDSARWGPGVFFDLGALAAGDEVEVTREDGSVALFAVDRVERHAKDDFPTIAVYGNTDDAQLRMITCGGAFDAGARSYEDNIIVFATLTGTRAA